MDYRDVAAQFRGVLEDFDARHMTAYFEDGDGERQLVRLRFDVCDVCEGRGRHVNPSIDSHGLTAEDFDGDPDFAEDYHGGRYDVDCNGCHGNRVVPVVDPENNPPELVKAVQDAEAESWAYARECVREREMGY
jgi:hypothetical protein